MDWDRVYTPVKPLPDPPAPTLVEMCWRMKGPSGKVLDCGIYTLPGVRGFEVRAGYGPDDPLDTMVQPTIDRARGRAAALKAVVVSKGGFTELPLDGPR